MGSANCVAALLLVVATALAAEGAAVHSGCAVCTHRRCTVTARSTGGCAEGTMAEGRFEDRSGVDGWPTLDLTTWGPASDEDQAYTAGYLEGYLTHELMMPSLRNTFAGMFNTTDLTRLPPSVHAFINEHWDYVQTQSHAQRADPVWHQVTLQKTMLEGLRDGYNAVVAKQDEVSMAALLAVNMVGDMESIMTHLQPLEDRPDYSSMTPGEAMHHSIRHTKCSALVRLTADYSELFITHNTWTLYSSMLRVWKRYNFGWTSIRANRMTFPSYPGLLWSMDDYYLMGTGLAVQETTNHVYNNELYDLITPNSLMTMWRVMAANRLAASGPDWTRLFNTAPSGTYNNQWMILDYNLFTPGEPRLPAHLLTIAEEFPAYYRSADVTHYLQLGYWPSFNRPFFEDGFVHSGTQAMVDRFGTWYSYTLSPRSKLFRRDAGSVEHLDDLKRFMRYNKWQSDPFSDGAAVNAIACRSDLMPDHGTFKFMPKDCEGAIDVKITSSKMFRDGLSALVIAGPTTDDQKPFQWSNEWNDAKRWAHCAHLGQPLLFDFDWVKMGNSSPVYI